MLVVLVLVLVLVLVSDDGWSWMGSVASASVDGVFWMLVLLVVGAKSEWMG